MNIFGKVEIILNEHLAIISSSDDLLKDQVVDVVSVIDNAKLKEMGYSESIFYPKGKLKVLCHQEKKLYLAESFRLIQKKTRTVLTPSPLELGLSGILSQFRPGFKEITEEVPGEPSAELNKAQSLDISISNVVSVGDLIGRLS